MQKVSVLSRRASLLTGTLLLFAAQAFALNLQVTVPASVTEGSGVLTNQGRVILPSPLLTNLTVSLTSSDTTEVTVPASVTLLAGETNKTFDLTIPDDTLIDGAQAVTITAHADDWTDGTAVINVLDNESLNLTVTVPASALESTGTIVNAGNIILSGTLPTNLTVSLMSSDTTEATVAATLTLLAARTNRLFNLTMVNDAVVDGDQPVTITVSAPGFVNGSAIINVIDDEAPAFSVLDTVVPEGNAGLTPAVFNVRLSLPNPTNATVNYTTANGTALAGSDYIATNGVLTFLPGQTNQTVTVQIIGDTTGEASETFSVVLSGAVNALITKSTGIGTIINDDVPRDIYLRSTTAMPWGSSSNETAMNRAFGVTNWQDLRYETVNPATVFSPVTRFVFMEGSDSIALEMQTFLTANLPLIENWVAAGGRLFINSAPNEGTGMYFGFGVNLFYPAGGGDSTGTGGAVNLLHPIFQGPFTPVGTSWSGSSFGHATVNGTNLTAVITNSSTGRIVLGSKQHGAGLVLFGGMTTDNFHNPQPQASNLRANILAYTATVVFCSNCPPVIGSQPGSQSVRGGTNVTFSVSASGTPPLAYQWRKDGTNLAEGGRITGTKTTSLSISSCVESDSGLYSVVVTNAFGSAVSADALLTVSALDHFTWSAIPSPRVVSNAFPVTIEARDLLDRLVTNFTGSVALSGFRGTSNSILPSPVHTDVSPGDFTLGYAFTPNTNITVTAVRHYWGTKVSIWTDGGVLLAAQPVASVPGSWAETPLPSPIQLNAGTRYRVAAYTGGGANNYYWRTDGLTVFPNGTINQGYEISGDNFPATSDSTRWWFVDLRYTVGAAGAIPISPTNSGSFIGGVWTGNLAVLTTATNMALVARDPSGRTGQSNPFHVVRSNQPPVVLIQPRSQQVVTGATVNLFVSALGTPQLTYQWRFNGTNLFAQTTAYLSLSGALTNQSGNYDVVVGNAFGSITSAVAAVSVVPLPPFFDDFEPGIHFLNWSNFSAMVGATNYGGSVSGVNSLWFGGDLDRFAVSRSVDTRLGGVVDFHIRLASGSAEPWEQLDVPDEGVVLEYSTDGGFGWTEFGRYDTFVYTNWTHVTADIPVAAQTATTMFRWRQLSNSGACCDHWALDDVGVFTGPRPPMIFNQPLSQTIRPTSNVTISVGTSGSPPLFYQWRKNGTNLANGGRISGAMSATITILNCVESDSGLYSVVVTNAYGTATSSNALLTVNALDHFVWSAIPSPQIVSNPFPVTIEARDFLERVVASFTGSVALSAARGSSNTILASPIHNNNSSGDFTLGYAFTPNTNITVTAVRHYWGTKVSIWTDGGVLLAAQPVASVPGSWVETPLLAPVQLNAGTRYRVAAYTGGGAGGYYWRTDGVNLFPNGTIDEGYEAGGDNFPAGSDGVHWWFVDLRYTIGTFGQVPISPTNSGSFVAGVWTGNISVLAPATNLTLFARSASGQGGQSSSINVVPPNQPPILLTQPASQQVATGAVVSLSVTVFGTPPLTYQWRFKGTNLNGETNANLIFSGALTNQSGNYDVVVGNAFGSITSAVAVVSVVPLPPFFDDFEPGIHFLNWSNFSVMVRATNYGGSVSGVNSLWFGGDGDRFAISRVLDTHLGGVVDFYLRLASGGVEPWEQADVPGEGVVLEYSNNGGLLWTEFGRYDSSIYTTWTHIVADIPGPAQTATTMFRWRQLSNSGACCDHWALDDVSVITGPRPPMISLQPVNRIAVIGGSVSFTVSASGSAPLSYQWRRNGTNIAGATSTTYTIPNAQSNLVGNYSVVVSNLYGLATSQDATLTVLPPSAVVAVFDDPFYVDTAGTLNSESDNVQATTQVLGYPVVPFTDVFVAANTYQRIIIPEQEEGLLAPNLSVAARTALSNFVFNGGKLIVHGTAGGSAANLLNSVFGFAVNEVGSVGFSHGLSSEVNGTSFSDDPPLIFDNFSTTLLLPGTLPPGASSIYTNDTGSAVVLFEQGNGFIVFLGWDWDNAKPVGTANGGWLNVLESALAQGPLPPRPPAITIQPANQSIVAGGVATFTVGVSGTAPLAYQWRKDGTNIPNATNAVYIIVNAQSPNLGAYSVVITNFYGSVTSSNAVLVLLPPNSVVGIFDNPTYVDSAGGNGAESDNLQATVQSFGFPIATFTNILSGLGIYRSIIIPEQENRALAPDLPLGSRAALSNFVVTGGKLIIGGSSSGYAGTLINAILGTAIQELGTGNISTRSADAIGTEFADDPATIPANNATTALTRNTLPPGTLNLYTNVSGSAVALIRRGDGFIAFLGWDWFDAAPIGTQNSGWLNVLRSALVENTLCSNCPPRITLQPTNQAVLPGTNVTLAVSAIGTGTLRYQWRFEGTNIVGATNATYSFINASLTNHGNYSVVITDDVGTTISSNAFINVLIRPGFVTQPQSQTVLQGGTAIFSVVVTGAPPIYFRWIRNGFGYQTSSVPFLILTNCQTNASIRVAVTNLATGPGGINSSVVQLIVLSDLDQDGMADVWEAQYGFNTNNAADALLDLDNDGMINRDEYVAGTDPSNPLSLLKLAVTTTNSAVLEFVAQSNVTYTIQYRTNLSFAVWSNFMNIDAQPQARTVQVNTPGPPASPWQQFYRIVTPLVP